MVVPTRRRRTVPILAGAAAAALAAGAIAVPAVMSVHGRGHGPAVPPRPLDAKSVLLASAELTEHRPAAAHGSYWYSQIRVIKRVRQPGDNPPPPVANEMPRTGPYYPFRAYETVTWENWDPYQQGRPSRSVDRDVRISFATPADKAAWQRAGSPPLAGTKPFTATARYNEPYLELGPKGTKMADLPKLPDTVAGLEKLVRADRKRNLRLLTKFHAKSQEPSYLQNVVDAAMEIITSPAPPNVRAAAYRMLAAQPGIRSLGQVRDGLGRSGVALSVPAQALVSQRVPKSAQRGEEHLVIKPVSGEILAKEFHPVGRDGEAESEPVSSTLIVRDGWTDRIGAVPRS